MGKLSTELSECVLNQSNRRLTVELIALCNSEFDSRGR